ncbi:SAM-dependent methyltransferase [Amorphus suaedae]
MPRTLGLDELAGRARGFVIAQFRRPTGKFGKTAGLVMGFRPSNRKRIRWAVEQLALDAGDRLLEFGCGPGVGVRFALEAGAGQVLALDHSIEMIRQADWRNRRAVDDGRVVFRLGGLETLRREDGPLDAAMMVNVVHFLPDRIQAFDMIGELLAEGGRLVVVYQPRLRKVGDAELLGGAEELADEMREAGFVDVACHRLELSPNPALCVVGRAGAAGPRAFERTSRRMPPSPTPARPVLRLVSGGAPAE